MSSQYMTVGHMTEAQLKFHKKESYNVIFLKVVPLLRPPLCPVKTKHEMSFS